MQQVYIALLYEIYRGRWTATGQSSVGSRSGQALPSQSCVGRRRGRPQPFGSSRSQNYEFTSGSWRLATNDESTEKNSFITSNPSPCEFLLWATCVCVRLKAITRCVLPLLLWNFETKITEKRSEIPCHAAALPIRRYHLHPLNQLLCFFSLGSFLLQFSLMPLSVSQSGYFY